MPVQSVRYEEAEERDAPAKASVFVFKDGKVAKRAVETDIADDTYISVTKGIAAGEKIVVGPTRVLRFLADGERVREAAAEQKPATTASTEKKQGEGIWNP